MTLRGPVLTKQEPIRYPDTSIAGSNVPLSISSPNVNVPANAFIWTVPYGPQRPVDLLTWIEAGPGLYAGQDNIFHRTFDYPNPRGAIPTVPPTWTASFPLQLVGQDNLLIRQLDWPNPTLAIVRRQDWLNQSFNAPAAAIFTPFPYAATQLIPTLFVVRRPDYQQNSYMPLLITTTIPQTNFDWPNPAAFNSVVRRQDWQFSYSVIPTKPTTPNDFPNPAIGIVRRQDWIYGSQIEEIRAPFFNRDWPNPVISWNKRIYQDFSEFPQSALNASITSPFSLMDWPNPVLGVVRRQDWLFSLFLQTPGFNQYDWPNPVRSTLRYLDWQYHTQIPTTVVTPNLGYTPNYDWPNPRLAVPTRQDFSQLNIATHAPVVVQPHIYYRHFFSGMGGMGGFNEF